MGAIQRLACVIQCEYATIEAYEMKREFTFYDPVARMAVLPLKGWTTLD